MFEEEVNSLLKGRKERQIAQKKCVWWVNFSQIFLQKRGCATKRIFRRLGSFDCQKKFTNSIYGEHLAKTCSFVFMSKIEFPFQKVIFTRDIAKVS
jgi:hypothetical protein